MTGYEKGSPVGLTLGGIELEAAPTPGVDWGLEDILGWYEPPEIQLDTVQRIVSHGQFSQPGHATGRAITINGFVKASSRASRMAAVTTIGATLADGGSATLTVEDADSGALWATVQRIGRPSFDLDPLEFIRFQLPLIAADAYRYGTTSTASTAFGTTPSGQGMVWPAFPSGFADFGAQGTTSSVTISNPGNAPATVKFTVTGPTPSGGFAILDTTTGKRISYLGGEVPTGSSIVLDGSDGSVLIDGTADRLGDTIAEAWPTVPAGASRDFTFTPLGSSTASVLTAETVATYW